MGFLDSLRGQGGGEGQRVIECRRCGQTVGPETTECPTCGATEFAEFRL